MKKKSKAKPRARARAHSPRSAKPAALSKKATAAAKVAVAAIKGFNTIIVPPLGTYWKGEGGLFAGIGKDEKGPGNHLLIAHFPGTTGDHAQALALPKGLTIDGKSDFEVANDLDGALCYATLKDKVKPGWYWLRDQHPDDSDWARIQSFDDGSQGFLTKGIQCALFVVRRIPIR